MRVEMTKINSRQSFQFHLHFSNLPSVELVEICNIFYLINFYAPLSSA